MQTHEKVNKNSILARGSSFRFICELIKCQESAKCLKMRSIYEIIEEMDKHSQLFVELDDNLSAVQTIFSNFNDHIKPFRNIQIIQGKLYARTTSSGYL